MNETTLHDELKMLVAEIIEIDDFNDDDDFITQLGVDSMLALEIMARIETRYRIRIPEEQFAQMSNLNAAQQIVTESMQPIRS